MYVCGMYASYTRWSQVEILIRNQSKGAQVAAGCQWLSDRLVWGRLQKFSLLTNATVAFCNNTNRDHGGGPGVGLSVTRLITSATCVWKVTLNTREHDDSVNKWVSECIVDGYLPTRETGLTSSTGVRRVGTRNQYFLFDLRF